MFIVDLEKLAKAIAPLTIGRDMFTDSYVICGARVKARVDGMAVLVAPNPVLPLQLAIEDMIPRDPRAVDWQWQGQIEIHPVFSPTVFEVLASP